jgi:hypothetical protein
MRSRNVLMAAVAVVLPLVCGSAGAAGPGRDAHTSRAATWPSGQWVLSEGNLGVAKDRAVGLQLDSRRVMWVGGLADDPGNNNSVSIYDTRTRRFHEVAPVPAAKPMDQLVAAGVLADGTVVVTGGAVADQAGSGTVNDRNRVSYRYDPHSDRWSRTGDLPEAQEWLFVPSTLLADGRLVIAGGMGLDGLATGAGSRNAFVYDASKTSTVDALDPDTGQATGVRTVVQGRWDYTRRTDGTVSTLNSGHLFGNAALLKDGRLLVIGGHTRWDWRNTDTSTLARRIDVFDPHTGTWSRGAAMPSVPGEDDRIEGSHGGRANGLGLTVLDNGKVVIAGGYSAVNGESFFGTLIGRQSILTMSPAANPMHNRFDVLPEPIPPGTSHGGLFGDGGRGQVLAYPLPGNRVLIAGGQDNVGDDLFDTYLYDDHTSHLTRGPDLAHAVPEWVAQHPEWGYPADYQAATISTRGVSMNNSRLVLDHHLLIHGGAVNGTGDDAFLASRFVEQLIYP